MHNEKGAHNAYSFVHFNIDVRVCCLSDVFFSLPVYLPVLYKRIRLVTQIYHPKLNETRMAHFIHLFSQFGSAFSEPFNLDSINTARVEYDA